MIIFRGRGGGVNANFGFYKKIFLKCHNLKNIYYQNRENGKKMSHDARKFLSVTHEKKIKKKNIVLFS